MCCPNFFVHIENFAHIEIFAPKKNQKKCERRFFGELTRKNFTHLPRRVVKPHILERYRRHHVSIVSHPRVRDLCNITERIGECVIADARTPCVCFF